MCATAIMIQIKERHSGDRINRRAILEMNSDFRRESGRQFTHPLDVVVNEDDELEAIYGTEHLTTGQS